MALSRMTNEKNFLQPAHAPTSSELRFRLGFRNFFSLVIRSLVL